MRTTEELIADFKAAGFNKLRASILSSIWEQAPDEVRRSWATVRREDWLAELLSHPAQWVECALVLHNAGPAVDAIWERTEPTQQYPMSMRTANDLLTTAKRITRKRSCSLSTAVKEVLVEYDSRPTVYAIADGCYARKRKPSRLKAEPPAEHVEASWQGIRQAFAAIVQQRLADLDEGPRDQLLRGFERDLNTLLEEFGRRIHSQKRTVRQHNEVASMVRFSHVRQACDTLMIDPPKRGKPVDMKWARKQKRMLTRQYHPDVSPSESSRVLFEAVIAAYEVCEQYNDQLEGAKPKLVVHEGGNSNAV